MMFGIFKRLSVMKFWFMIFISNAIFVRIYYAYIVFYFSITSFSKLSFLFWWTPVFWGQPLLLYCHFKKNMGIDCKRNYVTGKDVSFKPKIEPIFTELPLAYQRGAAAAYSKSHSMADTYSSKLQGHTEQDKTEILQQNFRRMRLQQVSLCYVAHLTAAMFKVPHRRYQNPFCWFHGS